MKMLYFNNGVEDAAAFPVSALTAIDAGNDVVDIYFANGITQTTTADNAVVNKVVLACAADKSAEVAKEIALAAAGAASIHNGVIVVRDDVAGTGLAGVTGVTSITIDYVVGS